MMINEERLSAKNIKDIYNTIYNSLNICDDLISIDLLEKDFQKELQLLKNDKQNVNRMAYAYDIIISEIEKKKDNFNT